MNVSGSWELPFQQESNTCVVYARDTGAVLHVHTISVLPGGTPVTDEDVAEEALQLARQHEHVSADIAVIPISADEARTLDSGGRVDQSTGRLIVEPPARAADR